MTYTAAFLRPRGLAALLLGALCMLPSAAAKPADPAEAATEGAVTGRAATGRAAIAKLVGNTLVATITDPDPYLQEGLLYLRPDGTAIWVNIGKGDTPATIRWSMDARELLCLAGFPDADIADSCAAVRVVGRDVTIRYDADDPNDELIMRLEPGNSRRLQSAKPSPK